MNRIRPRVIFITGTDTGVGKTLMTGLLLAHLRSNGCHALAIKPFCSGGTADIEILSALQDGELSSNEINPFYFREPLAPLVAARLHRRKIPLDTVLDHIRLVTLRLAPNFKAQSSPSTLARLALNKSINPSTHSLPPTLRHSTVPTLLIEGSGGLLVPLGEGFTVSDLIKKLRCEVIVVSRNRLGTINHTLLTVKHLQTIGIQNVKVVLMHSDRRKRPKFDAPHSCDPSTASNPRILPELLGSVPVIPIPFLGVDALRVAAVKRNAKKLNKTLAQILR